MNKSVVKRLAVAAFGVGMAAALVPAAAYADPAPVSAGELASVAEATDAGMLAAMQRDFGISRDAALNRLAVEDAAAHTVEQLEAELAGDFGGAWLDNQQRLVVGVTDAAAAEQVRAAGAMPTLVTHSARQLDAVKAQLDRTTAPAAHAVTSWYVDV